MQDVGRASGAAEDAVWIYLRDIPAANIAEYGRVLPPPGEEAPQPNSISINPDPARSARRRCRLRSGTISTGSIVPLSTTAGGSFRTISRRHLNSWLAFTSCRRATIDTDDPGSDVSATI
jgi:hypothetical protein